MKFGKTLLLSGLLVAGLSFASEADAAEVYTVQSGDTLAKISQQYVGSNSLINTIVEDNSIANRNLIYVGQQLTINADTTTTEAATCEEQASTPTSNESTTTETAETTANTSSTSTTTATSAETTTTTATSTSLSSSDAAAKEWIAQKESSGSYTAQNGQYYGRYQLTSSYLNGDYSAANQEKVADEYVNSRYGSWSAAQSFWLANGWY
ncbi:MAG: LysM peptidoglycan-binding domain-containing protein [Enterococcus sp.]